MNKMCIFSFVICTFIAHSLFSQNCFEKGVKIIDPGIGLGIYKITIEDKTNATSDNDMAGAVLYNIGFEYGVLDWLGGGGKFNYCNYIENDSTSEKGRGIDVAMTVRFHALRTKRINLLAGVEFGYSNFRWDANDINGAFANANGTFLGLNLHSRFYFSNVWGMRLFYNFDFYNYPNGHIQNTLGDNSDFSLKSRSSFLLGLGLMFKFS